MTETCLEKVNFKNVVKGSFTNICSDVVPDALDQIMTLKEAEG
jgi:hypothetical protein